MRLVRVFERRDGWGGVRALAGGDHLLRSGDGCGALFALHALRAVAQVPEDCLAVRRGADDLEKLTR